MKQNGKRLVLTFFLGCMIWACSTDGESGDDNIPQTGINGNWRVKRIQVSSDDVDLLAPDGDVVEIDFGPDDLFSGTTTNNSFQGQYQIKSDSLVFKSFTNTEIADTPFGNTFFNAVTEAIVLISDSRLEARFAWQLEADTLRLGYGDSGTMRLERE